MFIYYLNVHDISEDFLLKDCRDEILKAISVNFIIRFYF